ncbi:MAG: Serine protease [Pseudomonadota bacterium]|nr:Serine protease [Pseudomonadota bacterium]
MNKLMWLLSLVATCLMAPAMTVAGDAASTGAVTASVSAEDIYRDLQDRIFQVQVIDIASNKKMTIGTGFRVSADGLIATNYHVVAEYLHAPEKYRVEYLAQDGSSGIVKLRDIDVIHDLAVVQAQLPGETFLELTSRSLAKGARIYAIGNPHDLGMSIVEGNYNGLLEKSLYEKILFSGALNPGMSGGPALNRRGEVIGINVSTAGNELSFLVPVHYLRSLLAEVEKAAGQEIDLTQRIAQQLTASQQRTMTQLLRAKWKTMRLGDAEVPAELETYFKCWGQTENKPEMLYSHTYSACASQDSIYISDHFETGSLDFRYDLLNTDKLNSMQFYNLYTEKFAEGYSTNQADKEDVGNYRCNTRFVDTGSKTWKAVLCFRAYKKLAGLHDMALSMASLGSDNSGLLVNVNASGLNRENAMALARKFMENITWQN